MIKQFTKSKQTRVIQRSFYVCSKCGKERKNTWESFCKKCQKEMKNNG